MVPGITDGIPNCRELFGTDAHKLERKHDPETSHDAAQSVNTTDLESQVYEVIKAAGPKGLISDQVRARLPHVTAYSSVTARYKALHEKGLIEYTGEKRPGISGRKQRIMRASA